MFSFSANIVNADTLLNVTKGLKYERGSIFKRILKISRQGEVVHKYLLTSP